MADEREAQLVAATVGERTPLNGPIRLEPYDPAWPTLFREHELRIRAVLGARVLQLEHVGSTSVSGLSAKPIIDIVMAVEDSTNEYAYVAPLEAHGYRLRIREPDWFEHRLLRATDPEVNLHVFTRGCEEVDRMLRFRDRLRADADDRALYELTKQDLAARTWKYTQHYADAKSDVVKRILGRAERES